MTMLTVKKQRAAASAVPQHNTKQLLFEDDEGSCCDDDHERSPFALAPQMSSFARPVIAVRPIAVRPIAVRPVAVVRPIAGRPVAAAAAEASRRSNGFYAATESARIPFSQVHAAVKESHEWERTWVERMHEVNPLLVATATREEEDDVLARYARERDAGGARNPSPDEGGQTQQQQQRTKRMLRDDHLPVAPARIADEEQLHHHHQKRSNSPVRVVRPIAVRVTPQGIQQEKPQQTWILPRDIVESSYSSRSLSPMTVNNSFDDSYGMLKPQQSHHQMLQENEPNVIEDEEAWMPSIPTVEVLQSKVQQARDGILHALAIAGGDTDSTEFKSCLEILQEHYNNGCCAEQQKPADAYSQHEGTWLTLTKPTFFGCLGETDAGDPMYTLGRMTFDMFTPSDLICSLQGNFNTVHTVDAVPESLVAQVGTDPSVLRTYK